MKKMNVTMNCPNCKTSIDIDQILIQQFEESIKTDLQHELQKKTEELNLEKNELKRLTQEFNKEKEGLEEMIQFKVKSQVQLKEEFLKDAIRKEINDEKALQLQALEDELLAKSKQLRDLNATKAQIQKLQRDMEEAETRIILQKEQELTERLERARSDIKEQTQQESFLKIKEKEKIIDDLKSKLDEAKRKAEQGSMQTQGEVFELFIEQTLRSMFPTDTVEEVAKGINGGDCIQTIRTNSGAVVGKILYEVKDTARFSNGFITKLKDDNLTTKADIMVIITAVMPPDMKNVLFGVKDGVWICSKTAVAELAVALRYGLLKLQSFIAVQQGRESKAELLYNYLTSEEFNSVFKAMLDDFRALQESHNAEKIKMQRLWTQRQKTLERMLANSANFFGSIKSIAGAQISEIEMLDIRRVA